MLGDNSLVFREIHIPYLNCNIVIVRRMKYNVNGRPIPSCDLHRDQYRAVFNT